jgi:hypothetical protein
MWLMMGLLTRLTRIVSQEPLSDPPLRSTTIEQLGAVHPLRRSSTTLDRLIAVDRKGGRVATKANNIRDNEGGLVCLRCL